MGGARLVDAAGFRLRSGRNIERRLAQVDYRRTPGLNRAMFLSSRPLHRSSAPGTHGRQTRRTGGYRGQQHLPHQCADSGGTCRDHRVLRTARTHPVECQYPDRSPDRSGHPCVSPGGAVAREVRSGWRAQPRPGDYLLWWGHRRVQRRVCAHPVGYHQRGSVRRLTLGVGARPDPADRNGLISKPGPSMSSLEALPPNAAVRGILPDCLVIVVSVQWFGSAALELTYKNPTGRVANELLYRHDEARLDVVEQGRPWSFDGDGHLFRLVSEAHRIRLAHLFDPVLAVHTSLVEPLPHQITAVYEAMLPRQPLRFLLADDPGAGKTIMAGLFIKELIARGDLQRCLVVCPGSLAEQWQDELYRRFQLSFEILTNDKLEAARTGNWFLEHNLVIARLDKLSRNEDVQIKLQVPECRWDLVVCDEAHKLSATFFGGEIKYTKRYHLGRLLSGLTRHFLLMTATPHNGKEEDFQLFMALLDGDRFEGRFRDGVHQVEISDLMRRMVKENLLKFDGTPLFPERIAKTVPYRLSDAEARLYREVTDYVREEFNRAEALANDKRAGTVGFALTILQRRLASSPEAIYQSLHRRSERLESRLRELELLQRGGAVAPVVAVTAPTLDAEYVEDLEEAPESEVEAAEEEILDQATAARSIAELRMEIVTLRRLEALALSIRRSGE